MDIQQYFRSIIEQDECSVVVCSVDHTIIYMNGAAAANYSKYGGKDLIGTSVLDCHNERSCKLIEQVVEWFAESEENNKVHTFFNEKQNKDVYMIALRDEYGKLIGYYEKHEFRTKDTSPFYELKTNSDSLL